MELGQLPYWLTKEKVLAQIQSEYNASKDFVQQKRELFRSREDLYMDNRNQENKVYVRLVFSTIQTLKALSNANSIDVEFIGRTIGAEKAAWNYQNLAKFDFDEMNLADKKDQMREDKYTYGVGIEIGGWRDPIRKCPITLVVDPRTWIPDVNFDVNNGHRYHGFELEMSWYELDSDAWYFNQSVVKTDEEMLAEKLDSTKSFDKEANDMVENESRTLWYWLNPESENKVYSIYRHFTQFGKRKFFFDLANDKSEIIRFHEIKPVRDEEKKNPLLIQYPVVVRNWIPKRGDPFGICVPDILEDKQRMMQLFLNLNRIKAEHEAWGDIFFYDPNVIKNIDSLKIPSKGWPKYVKADLSRGTPMVEAQKGTVSQDSYNMPSLLSSQWQLDIGLDARTMGATGWAVITATENQRVQSNANLRLMLGINIDNRAEKKFRDILWLRPYQQFFKWTDKKNIYINTGVGMTPMTIVQKDFSTSNEIDVKIISKAEKEEDNKMKLANGMPLLNFVLSRPWSKYGKDLMLRDVFQWAWFDKERANVYVDPSVEEVQANQDLELINRNEDPMEAKSLDEDHWTFVVIYQSAVDTPAKWRAIEKRMQLYVLSGQAAKAQEQMAWLGNNDNLSNTQAQLTSNALNQWANPANTAVSLANIAS